MPGSIVTREEAAKRLRCSMRTVERMLRDGRLGSVRRQDGRLSVDGDDLALVLANPALLEERRSSTLRERVGVPPELHVERIAPTDSATDARITPLDETSDPRPAHPRRAPRRLRRHVTRAFTALAVSLAAVAGVIGLARIGHGAAEPRPERLSPPPQVHTPVAVFGEPSEPLLTATVTPSSRGGGANTIAERPRRPSEQGRPITEVAAPRAKTDAHAPATPTVHNCGFGSFTVVAC